ncbi:10418_t:CDS:2 [Racocetra fulgida]|uniref:10418_t:CDS:1 n=1 Tax=Racocetra fulgida TaxID=60492 RepID=A0A9N8VVQ9_9GLOM|nr:10418_t:CDS:2 [Racocetra fulgida]
MSYTNFPDFSQEIAKLLQEAVNNFDVLIQAEESQIGEICYEQSENVSDQNAFHALSILMAANELVIYKLIECTQTYLIEKQTNPYTLFDSDDFLHLDEAALIEILKCDDLEMGETLDLKNRSRWSDQDFSTLEGLLHRCIPLIRFFQMSSNDYYQKVRDPFQKILPKQLDEDVIRYHLDSGGKSDKIKSPDKAILWDAKSGLCFGNTDLRMNQSTQTSNWISKKQVYEHRITESETFFAEEFEVFQIEKLPFEFEFPQIQLSPSQIDNISDKVLIAILLIAYLFQIRIVIVLYVLMLRYLLKDGLQKSASQENQK